jgi:regulatory protein
MTSKRAAGSTPSPRSRSSASELPLAERVWQRAVRLLAARDRSEQEIRDRLAAQDVSRSLIDATVRRLRQLHYLDDRRLARGAAEYAARRGQGSERVRAELAAKGVAEPVIDEALSDMAGDETERARQALARHYPNKPQGPAERARAARFLLRQGFPEAVVCSVLGEDVF